MGILRSDLLTHSQLSNEGGSIVLDGSGDYLSFAAHNAFSPATADVTFELWFYLNADSDFNVDSADSNYYFFDMGSNGYRIQMYSGLIRFGIDGSTWTPPASGVSKTKWHHVAGVREGNSLDLYLDGKHVGQKSTTASVTSTSLTIGQYGGNLSYNGVPHGYISNFRYVRGVVYRGEFTPPKFELKNIPGTIVLGCQSTSSATDFAVTPSTISVGGNTAASSFHPGLKKDITDTGVVFDGFGSFATSTYMVPPKGTTTERFPDFKAVPAASARGLFGGGSQPFSTKLNLIEFITISTTGNAQDFGDLTVARGALFGCSSNVRGVFAGGQSPSAGNTIDFVTISTTGDANDFGDLTTSANNGSGASNSTRGVFALGNAGAYSNSIDFITIFTGGNGLNFGDLTQSRDQGGSCASTTRGLFAGGLVTPTPSVNLTNIIDFVTISTTANAIDFGDLLQGGSNGIRRCGGLSNATRGLFAGGESTGQQTNIISFVTMATAGDAQDFGDLSAAVTQADNGASSSVRGVFHLTSPANTTLHYVTIDTTGNSIDFGDMTSASTVDGMSNGHGGLG